MRAGVDEELHAAVATEGQMGQEGHLDVVHGARITQCRKVDVALLPSALGKVDLYLSATNHLEVFF